MTHKANQLLGVLWLGSSLLSHGRDSSSCQKIPNVRLSISCAICVCQLLERDKVESLSDIQTERFTVQFQAKGETSEINLLSVRRRPTLIRTYGPIPDGQVGAVEYRVPISQLLNVIETNRNLSEFGSARRHDVPRYR